jgi:Zn-dependent membrane protease YugP
MPILAGLLLLMLLAVAFGPQWWVHRVLRRHGVERPDFPALRWRLASHLYWVDRVASATIVLAPVVFVFAKIPALFALQLLAGFLLFASEIVIHLVTLPVELDASFSKALPVLTRGRYLAPADLPAARSVLRAAAWTYVAAALATLLNVARWFRVFRF